MNKQLVQKPGSEMGRDLVQLMEWLKKADIKSAKAKLNITSIDNNSGERIKI